MNDQQEVISHLVTAGGLPIRSQDLAASTIFAVAFALVLPLALYRVCTSGSKWILLRPAIALVLQSAVFSIRAYISTGHQTTGFFIAMQTLQVTAFVLVYEPLATILIRCLEDKRITEQPNADKYKRIVRLITLCSIASLVMSIIVSTKISSAATGRDLSLIRSLRLATSSLFIVVTVLLLLCGYKAFRLSILSRKGFFFLSGLAVLILISGCYKLAAINTPASPTSTGGKIAYYLLSPAIEWLVTALYFIVDADTLLPRYTPDVELEEMKAEEKV